MTDAVAPLPRTICLAGADGSGKSTQAARLVEALTKRNQAVRVCTVWDMLTSGRASDLRIGSKADVDRFLAGLHPPARAMFLHMAMREALDRALEDRGDAIVLVVGYWLKYNATERLYGAPAELLDALGASFPPLSLAIELALPPSEALARKQEISGYESMGQGRAGFEPFQARVAPELARLRELSGMSWHTVDASPAPDAVEASILAIVDGWLAAGAGA